MATQKDIEDMYDWIDYFHTLCLGKWSDFSCAFFDGDFSKTLDQAQHDKHEYVLEGCRVNKQNVNILDIGCGWGPILKAIKLKGGYGIGLTLSRGQAAYCKEIGLDVRVLDWKNIERHSIGKFDAVISIGAFEHFCSVEEFLSGKQEKIYKQFFDLCATLLPVGGMMYLQAMTWGLKVPDPNNLRLDAAEGTPEKVLARLRKFYPGSWPPSNKKQIVEAASDHFRLVKSNNGRKDYIETQKRWMNSVKNLWKFPTVFKAIPSIIRLLPRLINDADFRIQIESIFKYDQMYCFVNEIMSHERLFFKRII